MMNIKMQKDYIRELGIKVAERASSKENFNIIRRWNDVNALIKPDRAPVWCRPVGAWKEIIPDSSLYCTDSFLQSMEIKLRKILFKIDVADDTPVYNYYDVNAVWRYTPSNRYGVEIIRHESDEEGGAWGYEPVINKFEDIRKLVIPEIDIDESETKKLVEKSIDVLGDILPIKLVTNLPATATLGTSAAELRGLQQLMMDTVLEPDLLHALMAYLRDRTIYLLKKAESLEKISLNNFGGMYQSENLGQISSGSNYSLKNCWCAANSQEFDQVSPETWEEFCLDYQKPVFELFGYVSYGCCENLTKKVDKVLTIPNLRILVCSAWSNLNTMIEKAEKDYVIMWRQKASDVLFPDETLKIKQDLENGCEKLKDSFYQIVLREIETLFGHPKRLHEWAKYAKEAAWKHA